MGFIEQSDKNVNRLMKEVTAGGVAGFVGRAGRDIDALFAGPFHPDSGHGSKNEKLLQKQLDDRKELRSDMEQEASEDGVELVGKPSPVGGYFGDIGDTEGIELAFDELITRDEINREYNEEMTPPAETEWKSSGWDYEFDENESYVENEDFINTSQTNMEYIKQDLEYNKSNTSIRKYIELEYDKIDASMGRDKRNKIFDKDYIQQSENNNEKEIEKIKFNEDNFMKKSEDNIADKIENIELVKDNFMKKSENNIENEINNIELVKDDFMKKSEDNITDEIENIELVKDDFLNRSEINLETIYKNDIGLSISIGG